MPSSEASATTNQVLRPVCAKDGKKGVRSRDGGREVILQANRTSKTLYVGTKKKGSFQHSSFLAGGATLAVGGIVAKNGVLKDFYHFYGRTTWISLLLSYFIGYSERSRGYKFYDPTTRNIFETGIAVFFEDIEFGGRNKVRDISFEEELSSDSIHTITFDDVQVLTPSIDQEVNPEPQQDNVNPHIFEEQIQQPQNQVPIRRSTRERRNAISDDYFVFLHEHEDDNGMMEDDPINFHQAMKSTNSQKWIDAMQDEYKSMQDNKVWELVPLPEGAKPIGCKWIFKTKRDANGNVERYKARLVAKGYTQKEGIDYSETFSPVSSKDSFRIIMALVAHFDLALHQMDVKTAFLNGDIEETIYMLLVNGIQIHRDRSRGILGLSQKSYIDKVLNRFGMQECRPGDTPVAKGDKFSLKQCPKDDLEIQEMQKIPYASAVGSLMYAQVCTRPDIAYIVEILGRYLSNPGMNHWIAAKRVMRYLQRTKDYMLTYRKSDNLEC
ncbi:hypothetical protein OROHE_022617 [Orobanche hederae]